MHGCTDQTSPHTRTDTHIFTHPHIPVSTCAHTHSHTLLLSLAEVVAEVVVARRFGDDGRGVGDGDVLQVQEAELDLHGEEDLQLAAHRLAAHLAAEEDAESVRPQAELTEEEKTVKEGETGHEVKTKTKTIWIQN